MMLLTLLVWAYMYARRIPFITGSNLRPEQLTAVEFARLSPPAVANPSDNLKNLFELPTIFYALVIYLYVRQQVDRVDLIGAWIFVGFRVLHSAVHCTINVIPVRFWLYAASAAALWFIVIRAVVRLLQ
jgi:hypothetical protein